MASAPKTRTDASFGVIPFRRQDDQWQVLVIQQRAGFYGLPKGRAEPSDDSPLASAQRELGEETGLEVDELLSDEPLVISYSFKRKKTTVTKSVTFYPALVCGTLSIQEAELRSAEWLTLPDALQRLTHELTQQVVADAAKLIEAQ